MDTDNDPDPPNTPITLSHINPTFDQNIIQSESWMAPEGSTLRFVNVDEGYRGWTNADIISMDWEPDAQCNMDCDDYQNFCVELFLVDNPEAYEDSSETRALRFASPQNFRSDAIPSIRQWLITTLEKYKTGNGQEDNVLTDISATLWVIWIIEISNEENNLLSTIREALYEAWEQGFREVIPFLQSNQRVKLIQTHCLTSLDNVPIMDDIATLQQMIKHIHVQVAPQLVLQEVQGLADMATVCFTRLAWI
nr:hypothetical protein CFP56_65738 [Quercus suber]